DIAARGSARRVPLREMEPRDVRLPGPRPEGRAVQLETRDDEEDPGIHRASGDREDDEEEAAADRTRDVQGGEHPPPAAPPDGGAGRRGQEENSRAHPR